MPLYEYACRECSHTFETLVRNDRDEKDLACPKCESSRLDRQLGLPAKPVAAVGGQSLPTACNSSGPPCGAPWCRRQ
jgi:putative FmdB family regulatory protein